MSVTGSSASVRGPTHHACGERSTLAGPLFEELRQSPRQRDPRRSGGAPGTRWSRPLTDLPVSDCQPQDVDHLNRARDHRDLAPPGGTVCRHESRDSAPPRSLTHSRSLSRLAIGLSAQGSRWSQAGHREPHSRDSSVSAHQRGVRALRSRGGNPAPQESHAPQQCATATRVVKT